MTESFTDAMPATHADVVTPQEIPTGLIRDIADPEAARQASLENRRLITGLGETLAKQAQVQRQARIAAREEGEL